MPDLMRRPVGSPHSAGKRPTSRPPRPNWRTSRANRFCTLVVWPLPLRKIAAIALVGFMASLVPQLDARAEDKVLKHFSNGASRDSVGMIDAREDAPADGAVGIRLVERRLQPLDGEGELAPDVDEDLVRLDGVGADHRPFN